MITFKQYLDESINDKGLFKAIFVIGLPGSGKSYTITKLSGGVEPRIVNTDRAVEHLTGITKSKKNIRTDAKTFDKNEDEVDDQWTQDIADSAQRITVNTLTGYIDGMLPLFVDGTSNNVSRIMHRVGILESLGYDVGIVFVNATFETAVQRANNRRRKVTQDFIKFVADQNAENVAYLKSKTTFFRQVDNDAGQLNDDALKKAYKSVQAFFSAPLKNPVGKRTLAKLEETKQKYLKPSIVTDDKLKQLVNGWYK
jgi:shikimate kinase